MSDGKTCCSGLKAIEFFEKLPDIIPEAEKTPAFYLEYEHAMNRIRYECYKGIGRPKKRNKAAKAWHHDYMTCGACGFNADEPQYHFCPNCGTAYMDNSYTQQIMKPYQMSIDEFMGWTDEKQ